MRNKFCMLVGLPASGKSTFAKKLEEQWTFSNLEDGSWRKVILLSSDELRQELYGSEQEQGNPAEVFGEMNRRTVAELKAGKDVVYDACNISSKRRRAMLKSLGSLSCEKICYVLATPYPLCQKRNESRSRMVPLHDIQKMYLAWNTPFLQEGWDKVELFYADGTEGSLQSPEEFVRGLMDFSQDNPYHMETLGCHMMQTREYLLNHGICEKDSNLAMAALLHDCGKPYTKTFTDRKGQVSLNAHYYQHEAVGAYDALFFDYSGKSQQDILMISTLINWHMKPMNWDKTGGNEKQKKLLGDELYHNICKLHEADLASRMGC